MGAFPMKALLDVQKVVGDRFSLPVSYCSDVRMMSELLSSSYRILNMLSYTNKTSSDMLDE
jgi:hypothetical protein